MKARLTITDDRGRTFVGEIILSEDTVLNRVAKTRTSVSRSKGARTSLRSLDFDLPTRAFLKRYVGDMGGPARFTLLLASLAKGQAGKAVGLGELSKAWNKMTQRMGGRFNAAYSTRAHENGWVSSPKRGFYALRANWTEIL